MKTRRAAVVSFAMIILFVPAALAGERPRLIAAGEFFSCAMTENGNVLCWGKNASGQLGDDSTTQRLTPVAVSGLTADWALAVGFDHACAIDDAGGRVRCWGSNSDGQLGNNSTVNRPTGAGERPHRPRHGRRRRQGPHLRHRQRRREVLGRQLGRPARQRHEQRRADAGAGERPHQRRQRHRRRRSRTPVPSTTARRSAGAAAATASSASGSRPRRTTPLQVSGLTPGSVANIFAGWRFTFAIAGGV